MASHDAAPSPYVRFVDIGANLLDDRFTEGSYFGKKRHEPDLDEVLRRAGESGVTHIIVTAGTLRESRRAVDLVRRLRREERSRQPGIAFGCTVGVHPTRCQQEFVEASEGGEGTAPGRVLEELRAVAMDGIQDGSVVALGEIGLDYDRLEFSSEAVQKKYLEEQLRAFFEVESPLRKLPLFLHNRNVGTDLLNILTATTYDDGKVNEERQLCGVVHSFDDSLELAEAFMSRGLYIGLNGCSLKTPENLSVVKELPLDRILLETDSPYCEIKRTHASFPHVKTVFGPKKVEKKFEMGSMVKGRNEPCQMVQVAEAVAGCKGISVEEVAKACYENSMKLYSRSWADAFGVE